MEFYNQVFDQLSDTPSNLVSQDFEQCTFRQLDLSKRSLSGSSFVNCQFDTCILTNADIRNTKLYDVTFLRSRLIQLDFGHCNPFGFHVDFTGCQLDHTIFLNRNLKKTRFIECSMKEAHFLKCDLTKAEFDQCNLELARFGECNLTQVNFSSSFNLKMDLDDNVVKKARFSLHNLPGLLSKYDLVIQP